jgi:hypothetical protein
MKTTYRRIPHAAHYAYSHPAVGHDLEQWDVDTQAEPGTTESARILVRHSTIGLPPNAEYHSGYLDRDGHQHWIYVRTSPLTGPRCNRCPQ